MRIGVNVRRLEGQRLGIGRYLEYMLDAWVKSLGADERMSLYLREPLRPADDWISRRFETQVLGPRLTGISWENRRCCRR